MFGNGLYLQLPHELKQLRGPIRLRVDSVLTGFVRRYRHGLHVPHFLVKLCLGARMLLERGADCHMQRHILYLQLPHELDQLCRADWLHLGCDQPAVQWHSNDMCQQHHEHQLSFGQRLLVDQPWVVRRHPGCLQRRHYQQHMSFGQRLLLVLGGRSLCGYTHDLRQQHFEHDLSFGQRLLLVLLRVHGYAHFMQHQHDQRDLPLHLRLLLVHQHDYLHGHTHALRATLDVDLFEPVRLHHQLDLVCCPVPSFCPIRHGRLPVIETALEILASDKRGLELRRVRFVSCGRLRKPLLKKL